MTDVVKYYTVQAAGYAEYTEQKSKFISRIREVHSRAEAEAFFARIKALHKDATHNVPAFVVGDNMETLWASDDGEPAGTSGMPIVRLLTGRGVTNVAVMVTRYYGGIKLGTGGLARAYVKAAELALEAAGVAAVNAAVAIHYKTDYASFERIKQAAHRLKAVVTDEIYDDAVAFTLTVDEEYADQAERFVEEITGGACAPIKRTAVLRKI